MNRRHFLAALCASVLGAGAARADDFPWPLRVRAKRMPLLIAGSRTMFDLNRALAAEFAKTHPLVDIVVEKGGSLPGLIALKRGALDVAAMERDLTVAEDDLQTRNFLVARNDITLIVNSKSPISSLSREQVRALLAGAIGNWKQVGGPDAPVRVISRRRGSTSRQFVEEVVLGGDDIAVNAREMENTEKLTEQVAADPFAIGYVSLKDRSGLSGIAHIGVDGVIATRASVLSGRYPYTQSLYLVLHGERQGAAAEFVAFARSPAGQKIVEQQRLVPVC